MICRANQLTSSYMMATLAFNELNVLFNSFRVHVPIYFNVSSILRQLVQHRIGVATGKDSDKWEHWPEIG